MGMDLPNSGQKTTKSVKLGGENRNVAATCQGMKTGEKIMGKMEIRIGLAWAQRSSESEK